MPTDMENNVFDESLIVEKSSSKTLQLGEIEERRRLFLLESKNPYAIGELNKLEQYATNNPSVELIETEIQMGKNKRISFIAHNKDDGSYSYIPQDVIKAVKDNQIEEISKAIPDIQDHELFELRYNKQKELIFKELVRKPKSDQIESPEALSPMQHRLNELTKEIRDLDENNGILIRQPKENTEHMELSKEKQLANLVLNALGETLKNTSQLCLNKLGSEKAYRDTAEVLIQMLGSINEIGKGNIKFTEDHDGEDRSIRNYHDKEVYIFDSGPLTIDGLNIDNLKFFIRPSDTIIDKLGSVKQIAQARTKISIRSKNLPTGEASIRIDPPDPRLENNIVFDLAVGTGLRETLVDQLDLEQTAGHHFQSGVNVSDFGEVQVADIHRAIARRLMELA